MQPVNVSLGYNHLELNTCQVLQDVVSRVTCTRNDVMADLNEYVWCSAQDVASNCTSRHAVTSPVIRLEMSLFADACVVSVPDQAQQAAKRAVALLDHPTDAVDVFEAVFLTPQARGAPYDAFWRVSSPLPESAASLENDSPPWRYAQWHICLLRPPL